MQRMTWGLALLGCYFMLGVVPANAKETCSLTVRVRTPDGHSLEVPIWVREESGRELSQDQYPGRGDVQFCDLGILPVTVIVGSDGLCNQVTIRDVPVSMDRPYLLKVTYDPEACNIWHTVPIPQCVVLFRVSDSEGNWVRGATIRFTAAQVDLRASDFRTSPKQIEEKTDRFGRALFGVALREPVQGTVSAERLRPLAFNFNCSESRHEQAIRLVHE